MPIAIGQKLESDFGNPLGLLSDCHRRIERFLDGLIAISEEAQGNKLDDVQRQQFEVGLRYFRDAVPKHTLPRQPALFSLGDDLSRDWFHLPSEQTSKTQQ
jgi:hypothetical protein